MFCMLMIKDNADGTISMQITSDQEIAADSMTPAARAVCEAAEFIRGQLSSTKPEQGAPHVN